MSRSGVLDRADELSAQDRALLTPQVVARWTRDLADDDLEPAEIAALERRRRNALATIRQGAELTDREWRLARYLARHEGKVRTYLQIAKHLWETPARPITASSLLGPNANRWWDGGLISQIQVLVHHLRKKLEIDPLRPMHFATVRGAGYVYYSRPPGLDDGIDYAAREREHLVERINFRAETGLELLPEEEGFVRGHPRLGPAYPRREPIEARVVEGRSERDG